jgi:hypothetical protein
VHGQVCIASAKSARREWVTRYARDGSGAIDGLAERVNISYRNLGLVCQRPRSAQRQVVLHDARGQCVKECLAIRYRLVAMIIAGANCKS